MQGLYKSQERWFDLLPRYLFLESQLEGKRVLEIDCGTGQGTALLARSAREVVSLCATDEELAIAQAELPTLRRSFHKMTPGDLPFVDGSFDVVLALQGPHRFGSLDVLAAEARRVVRGAGLFCMAAPNPKQQTLPDILLQQSAPPALGFYEVQRTLKKLFAQVKMVAQSPFFGYAMVDFSPEDTESISLDPSLLPDGSEDASSFLAFCGKLRLPSFDYSLIQLPIKEIYELATRPIQVPIALPIPEPLIDEEALRRLRAQKKALLEEKQQLEEEAENSQRSLVRLARKLHETSLQQEQANQAIETLTQEKEQLAVQLGSAQEKQDKLESERARLERVALEHMGKVSEQKNDLKQLEERNAELRETLVRLTSKKRELEKQLMDEKFVEKTFQASLDKSEEAARDADRRARTLEREQQERERLFQEQLTHLEAQRSLLQDECTQLRTSQRQQEEALAAASREREALFAQLQSKEESLRLAQDAEEAAKRSLQEQQRIQQQLQESLEGTETRLAALVERETELRSNLAQAEARLVDKEFLLTKAAVFRLDAEWGREELTQEVALLRQSGGSSSRVGRLESENTELQRKNEEYLQRAEDAEADLDEQQFQLDVLQRRYTVLSEERADLQKQSEELSQSLVEAEQRAAAAKERVLAASREASSARSKVQELEAQLARGSQDKETQLAQLASAEALLQRYAQDQKRALLTQQQQLLQSIRRARTKLPTSLQGALRRSLSAQSTQITSLGHAQAHFQASLLAEQQQARTKIASDEAKLLAQEAHMQTKHRDVEARDKALTEQALLLQERSDALHAVETTRQQREAALVQLQETLRRREEALQERAQLPSSLEELKSLQMQCKNALAELSATKAALDACRIARAEAERARRESESRTQRALEQVQAIEKSKRELEELLRRRW